MKTKANPSRKIEDETWINIFQKINDATANAPYPFPDDDNPHSHASKTAHRSNHNGTHALRKVFSLGYISETFKDRDFIKKLKLSDEEKNALKLIAYCYRLGRVDESGGQAGDDYRTRSAQIYKAYAKQLGWSEHWQNFGYDIISRKHDKPLDNKHNEAIYQLLDIGHIMDLTRCYPDMEKSKKELVKKLETLRKANMKICDEGNEKATVDQLFNKAIQYQKATGKE